MDLTGDPSPAVVVGVDGSAASRAAAEEGAAQAHRRLLPLRLVGAVPSVVIPTGGGPGGLAAALEVGVLGVRHRVSALRDEVAVAHPALEITAETRVGAADQVLVEAAGPEGLVVVGGRELVGRPALGPVADRLVRSAPCPVLVHRPGGDPAGPVVVGVDCRPGTVELVSAAIDAACVRSASLVVLHAWHARGAADPGGLPPDHTVARAEADLLARLVADVQAGHPGVLVELRLEAGPAAGRLLAAAEGAQLLVLGRHALRARVPARRTSGVVLGRARCPLLVVPVGADTRRPRGAVRAQTSAR